MFLDINNTNVYKKGIRIISMVKNSIFLKFSFFTILVIFVLSLGSAELEVKKYDLGSVIIKQLQNPAVFTFEINNKGAAGEFDLYNLVGVRMSPSERFTLESGKQNLTVLVYPNKQMLRSEGFFYFDYEIKRVNGEIYKDRIGVKIVDLEQALKIEESGFEPDDKSVFISIENLENINFENAVIKLNSDFFEYEDEVDIRPYVPLEFNVPIDDEKMRNKEAGPYVINAELRTENVNAKFSGIINYLENEGISVSDDSSGTIVQNRVITKTNEGNVPVLARIDVRKDIISRLVSIYSVEPSYTEREGMFVRYNWEKELRPGESFSVSIKTNYTLPLIFLAVLVFAIIIARRFYQTDLSVIKRVSYVKTKSGHFAAKIRIHVRARSAVENIRIIDRTPHGTKLYEHAGKPDKHDISTGRLIWNISRMNSGEERIFSYIVYSQLKVFGKLELPTSLAVYQKDGKTQESRSNRTFFLSENR